MKMQKNNDVEFDLKIINGRAQTTITLLNDDYLNKRAHLQVISKRTQKQHESMLDALWSAIKTSSLPVLSTPIPNLEKITRIDGMYPNTIPFDFESSRFKVETVFELKVYTDDQEKIISKAPLKSFVVKSNYPLERSTLKRKSPLTPKDKYILTKSLASVSKRDRFKAYFFISLAIISFISLNILGIHDYFASGSDNWLLPDRDPSYHSRRNIDPAILVIIMSFIMATAFYQSAKIALKNYIKPFNIEWPSTINKNTQLSLSQIVKGKVRLNLSHLTLRVVSGNFEHYKIATSHYNYNKTKEKEPNNERILFEKELIDLKKGTNLNDYLDENDIANMDSMFSSSIPTFMFDKNHGITSELFVQIIHPELIDHQISAPKNILKTSDFSVYPQNNE